MLDMVLDTNERDRRWQKIRQAMKKRNLGALVVHGSLGSFGTHSANLRYLTNAITEGYVVFPLEGEPTLLTFVKKPKHYWISDWRSGHPLYSQAISDRLKELRLTSASIGLVGLSGYYGQMDFPYACYQGLTKELPKAYFEDATDVVEDNRRIKSDAEIKCFEIGCEIANKIIQIIKDTAKPGVGDYEVRAAIMDCCFRNGGEPDSMLLYYSGKEVSHAGQGGYLQSPGTRQLEAGDIILTEFDAKYQGYMAQHNQPFSLGQPDKEWSKLISVNTESLEKGLQILKPGITAGELDAALLSPVKKNGLTWRNPPLHGLGLSLEEPLGSFPAQPLYKTPVSLVIEEGMVIEIETHVVTSDGKKGLHCGCPILVTKTGYRVLNKSWKPELKII